jgi:hypothetical protein
LFGFIRILAVLLGKNEVDRGTLDIEGDTILDFPAEKIKRVREIQTNDDERSEHNEYSEEESKDDDNSENQNDVNRNSEYIIPEWKQFIYAFCFFIHLILIVYGKEVMMLVSFGYQKN